LIDLSAAISLGELADSFSRHIVDHLARTGQLIAATVKRGGSSGTNGALAVRRDTPAFLAKAATRTKLGASVDPGFMAAAEFYHASPF
jgi:hypothetical protein